MRRYLFVLLISASTLVSGCGHRTAADSPLSRGEELFLRTPTAAHQYVSNSRMACGNCHSHAGRVDNALSLAGVQDRYPKMNDRDGRVITLQDRIRGCFERSENGTAPGDDSDEMKCLVAWIRAQKVEGTAPPATLPESSRRPLASLDAHHGRELFQAECTTCHGMEGGGAGAFPPLWGERAWNDGAGLGHVYKLAAFIHNAMPLARPGTISESDAQDLAIYIDSQSRPVLEKKSQDYPKSKPPEDAVYYRKR